MPRKKRPEPFSEEAQELVLERIGRLTPEERHRLINCRPEGVPEDWPSLIVPPPGCELPSRNGGAPPDGKV